MKSLKSIIQVVRYTICIALGTEPCRGMLRQMQERGHYGLGDGIAERMLLSDWGLPSCPPPPGMGPELEGSRFVQPQQFVRVMLPDKESLQRAEQRGELAFMPADFLSRSHGACDNMGNGGDPRYGRAQVIMNGPIWSRLVATGVRLFRSFTRQHQQALKGRQEVGGQARLNVKVKVATVGGTGSGGAYVITKVIREVANQEQVEVRITGDLLLKGTLSTTDNEQAALNQDNLLRAVQASSTGCCIDPATGERQEPPFDAVSLHANRNGYGNVLSLEQVVARSAQAGFYIDNTAVGKALAERAVDVEGAEADEWGAPRNGETCGLSRIHLDRDRQYRFGTAELKSLFCQRVLEHGDVQAVRQHGLSLARTLELDETADDNLLTHRIQHPRQLGGESVLARLDAIFTDRAGSSRGMKGCRAKKAALDGVRFHDMPSHLLPAMQGTAADVLTKSQDQLKAAMAQMQRRHTGVADSRELLNVIRQLCHAGRQALLEKITAMREQIAPRAEIVAESEEMLEGLEKRSWLVRLLHWLTIQQMNINLRVAGPAVLKSELEQQACEIAARTVIEPLASFVDTQDAWLAGHQQHLGEEVDRSRQEVTRQLESRHDYHTPLGHELVMPDFMRRWLDQFFVDSGGIEKVHDILLSAVIAEHGSLSSLLEKPPQLLRESLDDLCGRLVRPAVERLDVLQAFMQECPDANVRAALTRQRIQESRGTVNITGEALHRVPWIKLLGVPDPDKAEALVKLVQGTDPQDGPWQIVATRDESSIVFMQYRNGIALSQFIREGGFDTERDAERLLRRAADPVTALIPNANPTPAELKRVLTEGVLIGHLSLDDLNGYTMEDPVKGPLALGHDAQKVRTTIAHHYSFIVHVESMFAFRLARHRQALERDLVQLEKQLKDKTGGNGLLELVDQRGIDSVKRHIQLLWPYLSRVKHREAVAA